MNFLKKWFFKDEVVPVEVIEARKELVQLANMRVRSSNHIRALIGETHLSEDLYTDSINAIKSINLIIIAQESHKKQIEKNLNILTSYNAIGTKELIDEIRPYLLRD